MQEAAGFEVGDKATLLHKGFMTMGARTSPPLVFLLVLVEMALGVVEFGHWSHLCFFAASSWVRA